jgi:DNA-binding GntR family transcriptional regulator
MTRLTGTSSRSGAVAKAQPALRKTKPRNVGDWRRVADSLQTDIILGRLFPRERLVEDELMRRFDTSRHAVRSAFDEMQRSGLIEREANRGAWVRSYPVQEVEELFELQETLEAQAIRRMPLPVGAEVISRLKVLQQAHEAAGKSDQPLEIFRANREFHEVLFGACGSTRLAEAIRGYALMTDPIRMRRIPDAAWRKEAAKHHRQMIDALRDADRERLARLCRAHIEPTKLYYLAQHATGLQKTDN